MQQGPFSTGPLQCIQPGKEDFECFRRVAQEHNGIAVYRIP